MNSATKTFLLVSAAYLLVGTSVVLTDAQARGGTEEQRTENRSEEQTPVWVESRFFEPTIKDKRER